ncbi:unnamed protein product [Sphagnum troendelagicum]|uniref:Secreted protein n=1 Tax=Sphagnum troendelagicum TaxID=128251 RepID=A0ABP0UXK1_9BRYO
MMMRLVTAVAAQDSPIHCAAATAACASSNNVSLNARFSVSPRQGHETWKRPVVDSLQTTPRLLLSAESRVYSARFSHHLSLELILSLSISL